MSVYQGCKLCSIILNIVFFWCSFLYNSVLVLYFSLCLTVSVVYFFQWLLTPVVNETDSLWMKLIVLPLICFYFLFFTWLAWARRRWFSFWLQQPSSSLAAACQQLGSRSSSLASWQQHPWWLAIRDGIYWGNPLGFKYLYHN